MWHSLVSVDGERAAPRVVRVRLRTTSVASGESLDDETTSAFSREIQSGLWWGQYPWLPVDTLAGSLRLRWGSSPGIYRDVFIDLHEGEYNLSPCEHVQVACSYWDPRPPPMFPAGPRFRPDLEVSVEIAEGEALESTPMVLTASCRLEDNKWEAHGLAWVKGGSYPPGAYAVDGYAGNPGLLFTETTSERYGLRIERAPLTGRWLPPTSPILLGKSRDFWARPADSSVVSALSGWRPTLSFYMR